MQRTTLAVALSMLLLPLAGHADSPADENARLRLEVQDLKARNDALQRMCVSAAQPAAAAAPAREANVATPASPASAAAAPVAAAAAAPPTGEEKPKQKYADAGCDLSLFHSAAKSAWQISSNWDKVKRGATMQEVETALGVEHYDKTQRNGDVQWEYGSCGSSWEGAVLFSGDKVVSVTPPDR